MNTTETPTPKRGRPRKYPEMNETLVTRPINLPPSVWSRLDLLRGDKDSSQWIFDRIKEHSGA